MKDAWGGIVFDVSEQYRTTETWILKGSDEATELATSSCLAAKYEAGSSENKTSRNYRTDTELDKCCRV